MANHALDPSAERAPESWTNTVASFAGSGRVFSRPRRRRCGGVRAVCPVAAAAKLASDDLASPVVLGDTLRSKVHAGAAAPRESRRRSRHQRRRRCRRPRLRNDRTRRARSDRRKRVGQLHRRGATTLRNSRSALVHMRRDGDHDSVRQCRRRNTSANTQDSDRVICTLRSLGRDRCRKARWASFHGCSNVVRMAILPTPRPTMTTATRVVATVPLPPARRRRIAARRRT